MKGPTDKPAVKPRKVDLKAKVVTDAIYLEELQSLEQEADKKMKETKRRKGRKSKSKKHINFDDVEGGKNTEKEEMLVLMEEQSVSSDSGAEGNRDERDLKELWKKLSPSLCQKSPLLNNGMEPFTMEKELLEQTPLKKTTWHWQGDCAEDVSNP